MGDEDSEYGVSKRYRAPVLSERAGATGMQEELATATRTMEIDDDVACNRIVGVEFTQNRYRRNSKNKMDRY
jgi:hypothetical protein